MSMPSSIHLLAVRSHARGTLLAASTRSMILSRVDARNERGDVAARTVGIAIMAALAITVGGIIATKVTGKANAIELD